MKLIYGMLAVALLIFSCKKDTELEKYFSEAHLKQLRLDSLVQFWDEGNKLTSFYCGPGFYFKVTGNCLNGLGVDQRDKMVWVNVFSSQKAAIEAMEYRINNVPAHIVEGTGHGFTDKWWIEEGSDDPAIFVNKWNTIIELNYLMPPAYDIGDRLYNSALDIANRVDSLSVFKEKE